MLLPEVAVALVFTPSTPALCPSYKVFFYLLLHFLREGSALTFSIAASFFFFVRLPASFLVFGSVFMSLNCLCLLLEFLKRPYHLFAFPLSSDGSPDCLSYCPPLMATGVSWHFIAFLLTLYSSVLFKTNTFSLSAHSRLLYRSVVESFSLFFFHRTHLLACVKSLLDDFTSTLEAAVSRKVRPGRPVSRAVG